ncbi:MAG: phosphatase PAP2 family protein [Gemmatimonadetes bacterium]|nr:phosphatase PAP2 family protein [Gemmatimonadota bacterium]
MSGQSPSLFVTDPGALFDTGDAVVLLGLVALHAAFLPVDGEVHGGIQDMRSGATDALAAVVEPMGRSALWFEASATSYVIGKILGEERVADVGLHLFLSLGLSNAISVGLKDLSGRARPCWGDGLDPDPNSWSLYGGASDAGRRSYPSNHATSAFTVAAVLSEELGGATPWIAYPVAGLVAWSRVHDNAHWASDVTLGAAVGIFSARLMVRHGHSVLGGLEESLLVESDADGESVRLGLQLELGGGR